MDFWILTRTLRVAIARKECLLRLANKGGRDCYSSSIPSTFLFHIGFRLPLRRLGKVLTYIWQRQVLKTRRNRLSKLAVTFIRYRLHELMLA